MKNLFSKSFIAIAIVISIFSCSKEGPQGPAGNANVIYTNWTTRTFTGGGGGSDWQTNYNIPEITQSILDSGLILTYLRGTEAIVPLPVFVPFRLEVFYRLGNILHYANYNATGLYRTIIIPSVVNPTGRTSKSYRSMSYQEICSEFDIPE